MYLLDTNALLIFLKNDGTEASLTEETKKLMVSESKLYLSIVSL